MKFFKKMKDGGPLSTVTGYWLAEIKSLFSVVLLKFEDGSRDAYHTHAFNSLNWVLKGEVVEERIFDEYWERRYRRFRPSLKPIYTSRDNMHQVRSRGTTWVLSLRGPWAKTWREYLPTERRMVTLTHGREEVTD